MKIYSRSLGDEAVRIVVSSLEKNKRKVYSLTIFMGRMEDKPSKKKFTGLHAKDEHYVDNFKTLLRALTKEEYQALKVQMLEKENIDLDTIPIFCTEYSIHPKTQNGKLSPTISYLSSQSEMSVENRKKIVDNLRNEPLTMLSNVHFHFSSPIIKNELKRPNILKNFDYKSGKDEDREMLSQDSITKSIEELYSLYYEEFPLGDKTVKL
uniref:Uncharacterized protein n=1 Tax=Romanomermis culicivorax TaxID=13658 RepID=A0A915KVB3_ROMCU